MLKIEYFLYCSMSQFSAWVRSAWRHLSSFSYCWPSTAWISCMASALWMYISTLITCNCLTSFSISVCSLIWEAFLFKDSWNRLLARSYSSSFFFRIILVLFDSNNSDWRDSALEVTSSNCCFTSLFSSNKSDVTLSEISNLDSARSALIFAFARDLFAQLRETFRLLSSINRFLFCYSNSAIANSVSQRNFVSWVSEWELKSSGSVWVAIDTVLVVQSFDLVSDEEVLQ